MFVIRVRFNERTNLLRSLLERLASRATDSRKESRCLSSYPIQLSKNRLSSKGRPICQTPPSVSSEMFPGEISRANPSRLTRILLKLRRLSGVEKIELLAPQEPQILGAARRVVNFSRAGNGENCLVPLVISTRLPACRFVSFERPLIAWTMDNPDAPRAIPASSCTTRCAG